VKIPPLIFILSVGSLLSSCASNHELNSGDPNYLGGGYQVEKEAGNKVAITAKTNFAPWENKSGARSKWAKLAEEACGNTNYIEEDIREYSYDTVPPLVFVRYIVTVKEGFAVCQS
jgi:hypothetical protein